MSVAIRWVRDGADLSGQLQVAHLEGEAVTSHAVGFTGSVVESDILLEFDQGFGFTTSWSGTISGDELTFSVSDSDGTLTDLVAVPGDAAAFNEGVENLQVQARAARDDLAAREAVEETNRRREAARQQAERDRRNEQQARDDAISDIEYHLEAARAQLEQADERSRESLATEIATLENEVATASEDYDIEVAVPYALNVAVAYERDAIREHLAQARSALAQAREVGPLADSFATRIEAMVSEANEISSGADTRWDQAVALAARVGVQPESP